MSTLLDKLKDKTKEISDLTPVKLPQLAEFNNGNDQFYVKNLNQWQYYLILSKNFRDELSYITDLHLFVWCLLNSEKENVFDETDIDILLDDVDPRLTRDSVSIVSQIVVDKMTESSSVDEEKKDF